MKKNNKWFSCKEQPPMQNGVYKVQYGWNGVFGPTFLTRYVNGEWHDMDSKRRLTGIACPGKYGDDRWYGLEVKLK